MQKNYSGFRKQAGLSESIPVTHLFFLHHIQVACSADIKEACQQYDGHGDEQTGITHVHKLQQDKKSEEEKALDKEDLEHGEFSVFHNRNI
jgi:hypothetical protein